MSNPTNLPTLIVNLVNQKINVAINLLTIATDADVQAYQTARISSLQAVKANPTYQTLSRESPAIASLQDTADILTDNLQYLGDASAKTTKSYLGTIQGVLEAVEELQ